MYEKIDSLDGTKDDKLGEKSLEKTFDGMADAFISRAGKTVEADKLMVSEDEYSYIYVPEDAFYSGDSIIKVSNQKLKDNNKNLANNPVIVKKVVEGMKSYSTTGSSFSYTATEDCFIYVPTTSWYANEVEYENESEHKMCRYNGVNSVRFTCTMGVAGKMTSTSKTVSARHTWGGYTQNHNATGSHTTDRANFDSQTVYLEKGQTFTYSVSCSALPLRGSIGSYIIVEDQ